MKFFSLRRDAPALLLIVGMFLVSALAWPHVPDQVPIHFDAHGDPDDYGSRALGLLMSPMVALGMWALIGLTFKIDPGRANLANSRVPVAVIRNGLVAFFALMHLATVGEALGYEGHVATVGWAGTGLLFVALGAVMGKIRPNYTMGIRTPWTLASKAAWVRTHRLGGWLFVAHGFAVLIAGAISPVAGFVALLGGALANVAALLVYSYVVWKNDPDKLPPVATSPADPTA